MYLFCQDFVTNCTSYLVSNVKNTDLRYGLVKVAPGRLGKLVTLSLAELQFEAMLVIRLKYVH